VRWQLTLALLVPVLLLAACGSESDEKDPQAEAAIRKEIRGELTHELPAVCPAMETTARDDLVRRYLPRALRYCEGGDVEEIYVRSMRITDLAVDGETATADVAPLGGRFDRQTVTVSLSENAKGEWRLDGVVSFKEFDPVLQVVSFKDGLTGVSWTTPERVFGNCVVNRLKDEPAPDLEALVFDPVSSPFDSAVAECASRFGSTR